MLQTTSNISIKNHQNKQQQQDDISPDHQFSLPLINKGKGRNYDESKSQVQLSTHSYKEKQVLPSIAKVSTESFEEFRGKQHAAMKNRKEFAKQVRKKLDIVLGEMAVNNNNNQEEGEQSEDYDFEARVNENKELIRKHKIKKQNQVTESAQIKLKKNNTKPKRQSKLANRNQSLYEKRAKQYRNQSIQNKYLQKKKAIVQQKKPDQNQNQYVGQSMKNLKIRQQYYNSVKNDKSQQKKGKPKKPTRIQSYKPDKKQVQNNKSINVFDGIQNFLQNPQQNSRKMPKNLVGLTLLKAKRDIQDKIKQLNHKMGIVQNQQMPIKQRQRQSSKVIQMDESAKNWTKIQIKSEKIQCLSTNFDKQLQKITSLQERSTQCLQKYLEHRKILLQLQMRKKQPRSNHINSY